MMTNLPHNAGRQTVGAVLTLAMLITGSQLAGGELAAQSAPPVIAIDHTEYLVGSSVQISGTGFVANEVVTLKVNSSIPYLASGPEYDPFVAFADQHGQLTATWALGESGNRLNNYVLTATGSISGAAANVKFSRVAVLKSDKRQYGPAEIAQIFGAGFQPGEAITGTITAGADLYGNVATTQIIGPSETNLPFRIAGWGASSGATAVTFYSAGPTVVDDGGPLDTPGEGALEFYSVEFRRDLFPRVLDIVLGWNATWLSGHNNPLIFIDTNRNGRIDRMITTEMQGDPIEPIKIAEIFGCDDTSAEVCGPWITPHEQRIGDVSTRVFNAIAGGHTMMNLPVPLPELGLAPDGNEPVIVNVCSGADCVITPGSGFLTIDTVLPQAEEATPLTFTLASGAARDGSSSWTITPHLVAGGAMGSAAFISIAPGNYVINEFLPKGWTLTNAKCGPTGVATTNVSLPVSGATTIALENVTITAGQVTRCTFTVVPLVKTKKHTSARR